MTRGVPGTHDIDLMLRFFTKVKSKNFKKIEIPKFNKAIDDRYKKSFWYKLKSKPDVIIFEGWCVGAKAQTINQLKKPVNSLERIYDQRIKWRSYVNNQLKTKYNILFKQLDGLLYLKAKNFNLLKKWRLKQERKLWVKSKVKSNSKIKQNDREISTPTDIEQTLSTSFSLGRTAANSALTLGRSYDSSPYYSTNGVKLGHVHVHTSELKNSQVRQNFLASHDMHNNRVYGATYTA